MLRGRTAEVKAESEAKRQQPLSTTQFQGIPVIGAGDQTNRAGGTRDRQDAKENIPGDGLTLRWGSACPCFKEGINPLINKNLITLTLPKEKSS